MNKNEKTIPELEQELEKLDQERIQIASKIFSLKLKETIVKKILEVKTDGDDYLPDIDITDIIS